MKLLVRSHALRETPSPPPAEQDVEGDADGAITADASETAEAATADAAATAAAATPAIADTPSVTFHLAHFQHAIGCDRPPVLKTPV